MKTKIKKYPLIVSLIISCVFVVSSLFILGFFGMNLGTSLGGGSQFKVSVSSDANTAEYIENINNVLKENGYNVDSSAVEDNFKPGEGNTDIIKQNIVIKIAKADISDEKELAIREKIASTLSINIENISEIENITSVIKTKNVLFLGLAIGVIALCLFVMGWIRYDIFAGISFILSYLHNIILYLSVLILTRIQLSFISIGVMMVLTLIMSGLLVQVYEKNREESKLQSGEKTTITERMISSEKQVCKPYLFVGISLLIFAGLLMFVPVASVMHTAVNIIIALIVTSYTALIVGPGVYSYFLEINDYNKKAVLSRNENINKVIKKKVANAKKQKISK